MAVAFTGPARRLDKADPARVARLIGVGEDEVRAVMEVEAAGSGFDSRGRLKMLFEPHVFYRCLPKELRQRAVDAGLAYPSWRSGYPKDSYPRLQAAMRIHETAALKAASWGLGQILGENHAAAGYETPQAMVADFVLDEDNHLEAMIRFIKARGLDDEIRRHDWAGFAYGYNGPGYAKHNYHGKLAAAYARWRKVPDTPWSDDDEEGAEPALPHNARSERIRDAQSLLKKLGYHEVGTVDGKWGGRTRGAIAAFLNDRHRPDVPPNDVSDELADELAAAVREEWTRPIAEARAEAPDEVIAEKVPAVKESWWSRLLAKIGVGGGVGVGGSLGVADFISDHSETAAEWWTRAHDWLEKVGVTDVPVWGWLIIAGLIFALIWKSQRAADQSLKDAYREGEIN